MLSGAALRLFARSESGQPMYRTALYGETLMAEIDTSDMVQRTWDTFTRAELDEVRSAERERLGLQAERGTVGAPWWATRDGPEQKTARRASS